MSLTHADRVAAVIVTCNRTRQLAESLSVVAAQTYRPTWIIVVDNGNSGDEVNRVVRQATGMDPTSDLGCSSGAVVIASHTNLGGAGGFALGFLCALALGADAVWCADDDGRPENDTVLSTLVDCAVSRGLDEVSPVVVNMEDPDRLAFPLRRGLEWRRRRSELADPKDPSADFLGGIASLFNGALFSARALEVIGVPDYRLFIRGDEVEFHRRLTRAGLSFGTCLTAAYLHPDGADEFKPIFGGLMHTQYPDNPVKRFFTYRNRGYLMNQPGMRRLIVQEYARFAWFFLVTRRDVPGFATWLRLHRMGRRERMYRPQGPTG